LLDVTAKTSAAKEVLMTFGEKVGVDYANVRVLRRQDPILRLGLATNPNEREWRTMYGSEDAISTSIKALLDTTFGYGWAIRRKKGKALPARVRLEEFARSAVGAIPRFQDILRMSFMGLFYGWLPMQQIWQSGAFSHKGRSWWGITKIVEHGGEHFAWSVPENGKPSSLVYLGDGYSMPIVYDREGDLPAWMTIQCGSLKDPHGHAILSDLWFLWYRLRRMTEFYEVGARDALQGRPVVQERGGGTGINAPVAPGGDTGKERATKLAQLRTEIEAALVMFRETGVLVLGNNLEFKEFADPAKAAGWEGSLQMWRQATAVAIEGQTLTATVSKEGGSRALGATQKDTKIEKCRAGAEAVMPQVSRHCLHQIIRRNFPGEIDPEDLPDAVCNVTTAIDPDRVKAFIDMGGEVDAAAIAEDWGVPQADPETEGTILRRQEVGSLLPGVGAVTPGGELPGPVPTPQAATEPPPKAAPPTRSGLRTEGAHKFSSTQVDLPPDLAQQVLAIGAAIPDEDLAADGRETAPHVMVKYGIHTTDSARVAKVLGKFGPVTLRLGATELFESEEYDVLMVAVLSADLKALNAALSAGLEVTDTHPTYVPHVTIAYLKPGKGAKYWGNAAVAGAEAMIGSVLFTPKEGEPVSIPLTAAGPRRTAVRSLPSALAALGDHVDAMAGRLEADEASRVAAPWQAYLQVVTEAITEAAGEADSPFLSALR